MKIQTGFIVLSLVMFSPLAEADCQSTKQNATTSCKKVQEFATTSKADFDHVNELLKDKGAGTNASTALANLEGKQKTIAELITQCNTARNNCVEFCGADAASGDLAKMPPGQEGQDYCQNGQPKKDEDAGKKGQGDMSQAIGALASLLAALGQKPPTTPTTQDCVQNPNQAQCKVDTATKSDSTFADGKARESTAGGSLDGSGLSGSVGPAAGTPAAVTLSGALPGGGPSGGGGIGAAAAGSGKDSGKKAEEEGPKLNLASAPGGGGGGGGGSNGGGGHSGTGSGVAATRTAVDGDTRLQAAVEKAAQQRGLASDGPPGGITSSLSMDNFQKIEKRMQSERNQLNEF